MVEKNGKYPANARVDVDYSKGEPKIKFSYPKIKGKSPRKQAEQQAISLPHLLILLVLLGLPIRLLIPTEQLDYPQTCSGELYGFNAIEDFSGVVTDMKIICNTGNYSFKWNPLVDRVGIERGGFIKDIDEVKQPKDIMRFLFFYLVYVSIIIMINTKIKKYLIKQRWYQKWLPKYNAEGLLGMRGRSYKKFVSKDVDDKIALIPCFGNVILEYKTHGDFSKQLQKIKIREHRWNRYKKGKVGKEKVDPYHWYAIFYFKEQPKDGWLEVIYR